MKRDDSSERSAMLTMSYFHLWTLRHEDAEDNHVLFAVCLQNLSTWEDYFATCLNGSVISKDSARYISSFLSVYRVRPCDPNADARSDEDFSDEEFVLTEAQSEEALKTRVGGISTDETQVEENITSGKATHEEHSRSGMTSASHIWIAGDDTNAKENVMPLTKDENVNASLVAARASKRKEKDGLLTMPETDDKGQISADTDCSFQDIKTWLAEIRERMGLDQINVLNASQFEVVKKVAERVCMYGHGSIRNWKF